ncbi:MAG TPA: AmmeMemoRadiSam system protein B [bacterium]
MIRNPAVAGYFYPGDPDRLNKELKSYIGEPIEAKKAAGIVSPHAGYIYSGMVAGRVYSAVSVPDCVVVLGPNHTGIGSEAAIISEGKWIIPGGEIDIDTEFAKLLKKNSSTLKEDHSAHKKEHSLEVQVPFLYYKNKNFKIVPVCLAGRSLKFCEEIGNAIAETIMQSGRETLIVASTDMTHYESHETAKKMDMLVIEEIKKLSPEGLYNTVAKNEITMCGVIPTTSMLIAVKKLGAKQADLILYQTSGDVSGDYSRVVGYAGMALW